MSESRDSDHPLNKVGDALLRGSGIAGHIAKRAADLDELDRLDTAMLDTLEREFHDHGDIAAPSFDPSSAQAIDTAFSAESFLVIARDTFRVVQAARSQNDPSLADDAIDPAAAASLIGALAPATASRGDVAGIDIVSAEVLNAGIIDGREQAVVRFAISGTPPAIENWIFQRGPSVDTTAADEQHLVAEQMSWNVAHRGWRLVAIKPGATADGG